MKILAFETSSETPAFAAVELDENAVELDGNLKVVRSSTHVLEKSRQLSRASVLAVDTVLSEAGWTLSDVDAIAAAVGPGSWTGLRIGLTTAKTIAQARELPLIGVSSLEALALATWGIPLCDYFLSYAVIPCRPGEVYVQSWVTQDVETYASPLAVRDEPRVVTPQQAAAEILEVAPPLLVIASTPGAGMNAARQVKEHFRGISTETEMEEEEVAPARLVVNVARLAGTRLQSGERDDPLMLSPLYLAPSNAERVLAAKLAREAAQ